MATSRDDRKAIILSNTSLIVFRNELIKQEIILYDFSVLKFSMTHAWRRFSTHSRSPCWQMNFHFLDCWSCQCWNWENGFLIDELREIFYSGLVLWGVFCWDVRLCTAVMLFGHYFVEKLGKYSEIVEIFMLRFISKTIPNFQRKFHSKIHTLAFPYGTNFKSMYFCLFIQTLFKWLLKKYTESLHKAS